MDDKLLYRRWVFCRPADTLASDRKSNGKEICGLMLLDSCAY